MQLIFLFWFFIFKKITNTVMTTNIEIQNSNFNIYGPECNYVCSSITETNYLQPDVGDIEKNISGFEKMTDEDICLFDLRKFEVTSPLRNLNLPYRGYLSANKTQYSRNIKNLDKKSSCDYIKDRLLEDKTNNRLKVERQTFLNNNNLNKINDNNQNFDYFNPLVSKATILNKPEQTSYKKISNINNIKQPSDKIENAKKNLNKNNINGSFNIINLPKKIMTYNTIKIDSFVTRFTSKLSIKEKKTKFPIELEVFGDMKQHHHGITFKGMLIFKDKNFKSQGIILMDGEITEYEKVSVLRVTYKPPNLINKHNKADFIKGHRNNSILNKFNTLIKKECAMTDEFFDTSDNDEINYKVNIFLKKEKENINNLENSDKGEIYNYVLEKSNFRDILNSERLIFNYFIYILEISYNNFIKFYRIHKFEYNLKYFYEIENASKLNYDITEIKIIDNTCKSLKTRYKNKKIAEIYKNILICAIELNLDPKTHLSIYGKILNNNEKYQIINEIISLQKQLILDSVPKDVWNRKSAFKNTLIFKEIKKITRMIWNVIVNKFVSIF